MRLFKHSFVFFMALILGACELLPTVTPQETSQVEEPALPPVVLPACVKPSLGKHAYLERLDQYRSESCDFVPTIDVNTQTIQPLCLDDETCETAGFMPLDQAVVNDSVAAEMVQISSFGDIDSLIKVGLKRYEEEGINPLNKAVLASSALGVTGVNLRASETVVAAIKRRDTFVSVSDDIRINLTSSFGGGACDASYESSLSLPQKSTDLITFNVTLPAIEQTAAIYIVKHWVNLAGEFKRKILPITYLPGCQALTDEGFDAAESSAYFLVIRGTAATSPLWYLPPRG